MDECFCNVFDYLTTNRGEIIIGWAIWLIPHKDNINKILFLEDNSIQYKGFQIDNIRKNISKSKLIDIPISNSEQLVKLQNKGQLKHQHGKVILKNEKAEKYKELIRTNQMLIYEFYSNLKLKPNAPCNCGSNFKFVECCKQNIK